MPSSSSYVDPAPEPDPGPPCSDFNTQKNLYWGDLHTHTALSADAYEWGARSFPLDAYRAASDPTVSIASAACAEKPGPALSIDRKLDFAAVTDHSEWLDATYGCGQTPAGMPFDPSSPYFSSAECATVRGDGMAGVTKMLADSTAAVQMMCAGGHQDNPACIAYTRSAWQVARQATHDAYQRCTFTTLVGYEWTRPGTHQNVIFGTENVPDTPFDAIEYPERGDMWSALDSNCKESTGCEVLTIPHNSNLSGGQSFLIATDADIRRQMRQYERLAEIHQHKGNSECPAGSGSTDPTCDFEQFRDPATTKENPKSYVRTALTMGLQSYSFTGGNPLQLGIVASTDDHNGIPGYVKEDTWQGHVGAIDGSPQSRLAAPRNNPGGIVGVWAEQNTRESIFAALYRRETFGTSGPRIAVRMYQVWDDTNYCTGAFPGNVLAANGVPMGSTMAKPKAANAAPQLVINALQDKTPLAEVDIIKGTYAAGATQENVIRLMPGAPGSTWSNGSVCLGWTDPSFDPKAPTYYYVRILEQPTPRWSHYDCLAAPTYPGCQAGGPLDVTIQERAWTSPIWWLP